MPPFNNIPCEHSVLFILLIDEHVANYLKIIRQKKFNNSYAIRDNVFNHQISTFIGLNLQIN